MTTHSDDLGTADLAGRDRDERERQHHDDDPVVVSYDDPTTDRPGGDEGHEHEPLRGYDAEATPGSGVEAGMGTTMTGTLAGTPDDGDDGELFAPEDSADFERRWADVQTRFVDDPRSAVESADHLVAEVMQTLARRFADKKESLEDQWNGGSEAETEELRQALQRYRTFFHRLLAA